MDIKIKLEKKYGKDPEVKKYLKNNIKVDKGIYYKTSFGNSNCFVLLPYIKNKNNPEIFDWTEDKLVFDDFNQMQNFCETLDIKLINSKDLED